MSLRKSITEILGAIFTLFVYRYILPRYLGPLKDVLGLVELIQDTFHFSSYFLLDVCFLDKTLKIWIHMIAVTELCLHVIFIRDDRNGPEQKPWVHACASNEWFYCDRRPFQLQAQVAWTFTNLCLWQWRPRDIWPTREERFSMHARYHNLYVLQFISQSDKHGRVK